MPKFPLLAALIAILAFHTQAVAATVSFQTTLDLNAPSYFSNTGIFSFAYWDGFSGFVPAKVATGDHVNVRYNFANGVGVTAGNVTSAAAYILDFSPIADTGDGAPYEQIDSHGTLSFLDAFGNVIKTFASSDSECCISLGVFPNLTPTGPITFYALQFSLTVTASDPDIPRIYNAPMLTVRGSDFSIAPALTPIPATLPLFVSALGGVGLLAWRKRRRSRT